MNNSWHIPALDRLCAEYERFNRENGLTLGSADEHLADPALTDSQRKWLADFCERWDAAQEAGNPAIDGPLPRR